MSEHTVCSFYKWQVFLHEFSADDFGIEKLQLFGRAAVHFYASPGMADVRFLLLLVLFSSSSSCFGSELDIQCLKTVLQSVIDPNDILKSSWNFDNNTEGYICGFTGVECWHPYENKVLSLRLGNLGLQGTFPKGLQNCASMTALDLSSNSFSGPIPGDITRQVPYLTSLDLSYNSFSGEIPADITNMTYLNTLNLQHNYLSGQIPERSSTLARLTVFNVADNLLSGPIPSPLNKFPPSTFAGNPGLCGPPLDQNCKKRFRVRIHVRLARILVRLRRINDASSIGAAVGFVVGFVVAFYFPHWFIFCGKLRPYIFRVCV